MGPVGDFLDWYRSLVDGASTETQIPRSTSQFGEPMGGVRNPCGFGKYLPDMFPSKINHENVGKYTSFMDSMGCCFSKLFCCFLFAGVVLVRVYKYIYI